MIAFHKLKSLMESKGISFYKLKTDKIIGAATFEKIRLDYGNIDTRSINSICRYLNCQPGDIMEYIPDQPNADPEAAPQADQPQNNP